jgi:hypothetical protein
MKNKTKKTIHSISQLTLFFLVGNQFAEDQITLPAKLPNVPHPEPVVFPHCIQVVAQSAEERAAQIGSFLTIPFALAIA